MLAERSLAVGEGDVRLRLRFAYKQLRRLEERDLPPAIREEWVSILKQLTRLGPEIASDGTAYRTAVDNTMYRIKNSTGRRIAERIYGLNYSLQHGGK